MGDAENTFPPTKKRAAGRELSRDNPGLDDEEEVPGQETGTFKRASDEVLANRRIVKVKRGQTSSTPSAPSNPFAAIRLVPPTNSTLAFAPVNKSPEIENLVSEKSAGNDENTDTPAAEKVCVENKDKLKGNDENAPAAEKGNDGKKESLGGNDGTTPASEKENCENKDELVGNDKNAPAAEKENDEKKENLVENENKDGLEGNEENNPEVAKENDEGKENIDENDEKTPAGGSVNSFQQLSSSQNAFTGLVGTGFSNSTFLFGSIQKTDSSTFSSFSFGTNGNSSLFGNTDKKTEGTKITPSILQEVQLETGEENEKLTNMEKKGITFACLNSTGEGQNGLTTFALKFKDASIVEEFRSVVMAHKGNPSTGALNLKTPENSPKESDE
ncbi:hypothetical protein L1987_22795 [Smallanthus sonchifolius]|uniref:Uncharacterized protein n=1 Tax=Smallanthus sonchifolius TaxID=185202 RepID=A0ACB9IIH8_9ASTR|nr:hypothetical protein L1987_22795 [Smallanthus sonchifolius]